MSDACSAREKNFSIDFEQTHNYHINQAIIDALGHLDTMIRGLMSPQTELRLGMYAFCFILIMY